MLLSIRHSLNDCLKSHSCLFQRNEFLELLSKESDQVKPTLDGNSPYLLKLDNNRPNDCTSDICTKSQSLEWSERSSCHLKFVCTTLVEKPCEDFELSLHSLGKQVPICFTNRQFSMNLTSEDRLSVDLWYYRKAKLNINCFMWCSNILALPPTKPSMIPETTTASIDSDTKTPVDVS